MSLCSLSYLGGVLDPASAISCGSDAVTCPVTGWIIRNTWLWEHMTVHRGVKWLEHAIAEGMLVVVTDGSYIRELYPNHCSRAFVMECSSGRGGVCGSFLKTLLVANPYQGELLGLMAIHLILLSINKICPQLSGSVEIVSDCLGALKRVSYLPLYGSPCSVATPTY